MGEVQLVIRKIADLDNDADRLFLLCSDGGALWNQCLSSPQVFSSIGFAVGRCCGVLEQGGGEGFNIFPFASYHRRMSTGFGCVRCLNRAYIHRTG